MSVVTNKSVIYVILPVSIYFVTHTNFLNFFLQELYMTSSQRHQDMEQLPMSVEPELYVSCTWNN